MIRTFATAAVLAALLTAGAPASAQVGVNIRVGPPAPRYEAVPAPRAGYLWTPGYWNWRNNRYGWVGGNWVRERPGYVYTQPTWVNQGDRWHFYRGDWARRGDRDRDGVPNRFDRRPNNPYRR